MCKENDFSKLIENILIQVLKLENFKRRITIACSFITKYYSHTQIALAEKLGKRLSYIGGAGEETYKPYKAIELNENYSIIMQNFKDITLEEENSILFLFKVLLSFKRK